MKEWEHFEKSVAVFLQALDPNAKVSHDVKTVDQDSGLPRQRDVWVETFFGRLIPVKIHVSCKRWSNPLDQQDIDAFVGELISSGAHKGVLYSFSGFTDGALKKAKARGISCCKLIVNGPPEVPEILTFTALNSRQCSRLKLVGQFSAIETTLGDLFSQQMDERGNTALSLLAEHDKLNSEQAMRGIGRGQLPTWSTWLDVAASPKGQKLCLVVESSWQVYQARVDAWLLNGSYSFSDERYVGGFSTPVIDMKGDHPGPGWDYLGVNPVVSADNLINMIIWAGNLEDSFKDKLSNIRLSDLKPLRDESEI